MAVQPAYDDQAYEHAYRLSALGDDIRNYLRAIEDGEYDGPPAQTPMGVFRISAPVTTDEDREKVRKVIYDAIRQVRVSLTALEAAMGIKQGRGGVER